MALATSATLPPRNVEKTSTGSIYKGLTVIVGSQPEADCAAGGYRESTRNRLPRAIRFLINDGLVHLDGTARGCRNEIAV